jgi:hypothetical protein
MATGIEFLIKSLGIDPKEIISLVQQLGDGIREMNTRLTDIQHRLERIENGKETTSGIGTRRIDVRKSGSENIETANRV